MTSRRAKDIEGKEGFRMMWQLEVRLAVTHTLRQVAGWSDVGSAASADELRTIAYLIEQGSDEMCCPLCEETRCDEHCGLRPWRELYFLPR